MRRKLVALLALAGGMFTGLQLLRRMGADHSRVDVYYADGSLVTLSAVDAAPLLEVARTALRASRA